METRPPPASSYRALFVIPGVPSLAATMLLARLGGTMWNLTLILFVLQQFHSPVLAGLTTFVAWVPGLLVSPLVGTLIDRFGRARLIALDMGVAVLSAFGIVGLSRLGSLTPTNLLLLVGISSITGTLTMTGTRSLIPVVVPRSLWERGNALDATTFNVAMVAGPALAGLLFAGVGALGSLLVLGGIWLAAGLLVTGLRDIAMFSLRQRAIDPAWLGRAMSISMSLNMLGFPLGSALAGPAIHVSLFGAMVLGASLVLLSALVSPLLLPRRPVPGSSAQPSL
jgi:MFS family permease